MARRLVGLVALSCLACWASDARAQLRDGAHYEMAGVWSGGLLHATEIQPPEDPVEAGQAELEGRITAVDLEKKVLQIGPLTIQWSDSTKFEGINQTAFKVGSSIELVGRIVGPRRLLATFIERGPPSLQANFLTILGPVSGIKENTDGSARFEVLGLPVLVPAEVYRELRGSRSDARMDDEDEEIPMGSEISGEYEVKLDYQKNFALEKRAKDDLFRLDQELQLRWSYRTNEWFSFLVEGKVFGEHELYTERGPRRSEVDLERGETWIRFDRLFGRNLTLQLGRQTFEEPRRWWWDDELDAVRMRYRQSPWLFELGVGRELLPQSLLENFVEPENAGVLRVLARTDWHYSENHRLALFFLHQNDSSPTQSPGALIKEKKEDSSDAKLWWGGIRAMGKMTAAGYGHVSYWADAAMVRGNEKLLELEDEGHRLRRVLSRKAQRVGGWAVDTGGRWASELPGRPMFTLGYALGSGDKNLEGGTDRAFRQTGLQSNDEEFRTYGELLRPELSNLRIPVVAVQFPIHSETYIEFAYRHFRQHHAAPFLRDARIETDPNGINKNIGQEWMIYSAIKEWNEVEIELVAAAFRAGRAYGTLSGKKAYSFFTQVTYGF
jgi:alginate production protein